MTIGALIAGIASGVLLGSLTPTTVTTEFATNQAMMFALRIAMIAGGGGGLLTAYFHGFLCDISVFAGLARLMTLVNRLCWWRAAAPAPLESDMQ